MAKEKPSIKVKKKVWYEIVAPRIFDEMVIGETTVAEHSKLIGKPISVNLMSLTNDPKKQNVSIKFLIDSVKESKACTKVIGYYLNLAHLKRLMRRATTRIDDSFIVETSDNIRLRIKPFLLTRQYVTGSVSRSLRNAARDFIIKQVSKTSYEKLVIGLVTNKFQKSVSMQLKKIYPLRSSEVKAMYLEKGIKKSEQKPKEEEPKDKEVIEKIE